MRDLFVKLQYPKVLFADFLYLKANDDLKKAIQEDVDRYIPDKKSHLKGEYKRMNYCLITNKIYRNVFYFRCNYDLKLQKSIFKSLSMLVLKKLDNIEIGGKIQGGAKSGAHFRLYNFSFSCRKKLECLSRCNIRFKF